MRFGLTALIGLLVAATVVAIAAKRARVPYNVALVVGGMLIALGEVLPGIPPLEPGVVFLLCLPALLFEGGITADLGNIRTNAVPIAMLATAGMVVSIAVTATVARYGLVLSWGAALLLGAVLSVTDTVSILYAFRRVAVPSRLSGLVEGESLFNDGTALVAFGAIAGVVAGQGFSIPLVSARVLLATAGGIGIGLAMGLAAGFVIRRTQDPLAEIMATTALAYASYAAAEALHVSGVIAVVVAALAVGSDLRAHVAPESRIAIGSFWEYAAFGVNTFLFLSVGMSTNPQSLYGHLPEIVIAVAAVFAGRAAGIYAPFFVLGRIRPALSIPLRWQHVFVIGNVKGALSIALALGLPPELPGRDLLVDVVFGVTFVSLVGQGLLFGRVLERLGVVEKDPVAERVGEQQALLVTSRAARHELENLHGAGLVPRAGYERLRSDYQVTIAAAERELRRLQERHLAAGAKALIATRRRLVEAERTALVVARRAGLVPEAAALRLLREIDERMLALERVLEGGSGLEEQGGGTPGKERP